jgi:hypothetical protein
VFESGSDYAGYEGNSGNPGCTARLRRTWESGPFRVLTVAAGVPAGTEKRSVPRLIDYLRCTHNHRRLVCSHPAPGMDRSPKLGLGVQLMSKVPN